MNTDLIVSEFIEQAKTHGSGTLSGDFKVSNMAYDKIVEILKILHNIDSELRMLTPLLKHTNMSVRTWAATYLLPHFTEMALKVLDDAGKEGGLIAFSAEITAREWRAGRLQLLV
jgi:hypothetical protein